MANTKISGLTSATTPLAGTEVLPIVQSSTTKKVAVSDLTAGRAVAMATGSSVGSGSGAVSFNVNGGATSAVAVNFQAAGVDKWLTGMGAASANGNYEIYNTAGVVAMSVDKTSSLTTFGAGVSVTGTGATTGNLTVGAAAAGTNRQININGVANKAGRVNFQESGVDKWLVGNGAASENGNFEIYDAVNGNNISITHTGNITMPGNLIQGTAAKGVNFTANTAAAGMTSQLLNWYEEGTWTPNAVATTGTITTYTSSGRYTRVGRLVTLQIEINITTNGTGAGTIKVDNLPFTVGSVNAAGVGKEVANTGKAISGSFNASSTNSFWNYYDGTYPGADGNTIWITGSYSV